METLGGPGQPSAVLSAPAVCFICENAPSQSIERVVDTIADYWEDKGYVQPRLLGRKYVCEGCAHHVATALGYVKGEDHQAVVGLATEMQAQIVELKAAVDVSGVIAKAVEDALAAAAPKKKPSA